MSPKIAPDDIAYFVSNAPIELYYNNSKTYSDCNLYDLNFMEKPSAWHQIVVSHNGEYRSPSGRQKMLEAIFKVVKDNEFYPVSYRNGAMEDKFLVRNCKGALDKLFAKNLKIKLEDDTNLNIKVQLNVATFHNRHIIPQDKINDAANRLLSSMQKIKSSSGILNLSNFKNNPEFNDIILNIGNSSVFSHLCDCIYRNDRMFRYINGLILSNNGITNLDPLRIFADVHYAIIDLRKNKLKSVDNVVYCLKKIKADELLLAGNPIELIDDYPNVLEPILKNFKLLDGMPVKVFPVTYSPLDTNYKKNDSVRIDYTNSDEIKRFSNNCNWHLVGIPDADFRFEKQSILSAFLRSLSPALNPIFPSYYRQKDGEHQFLVRQCFNQLKHLVEQSKFVIKVLTFTENIYSTDEVLATCYLHMNACEFQLGEVEPKICIQKALDKRFEAASATLDLNNFQRTEGLENIIVDFSFPVVLRYVLNTAARKFQVKIKRLILRNNRLTEVYMDDNSDVFSNLINLDLCGNCIKDIKNIKNFKSSLKSLILLGNPLCEKFNTARDYIDAIKKYYPSLTELDGARITKPSIFYQCKNYLCDSNAYELVEKFIVYYFKHYESGSRTVLKNMYNSASIFTMSCSFDCSQTEINSSRIEQYEKFCRNLKDSSCASDPTKNVFVGTDKIMNVLNALPEIAHDFISFQTDVPIVREKSVIICVHGTFIDKTLQTIFDPKLLIAFSRIFCLKAEESNLGLFQGSTSYTITNDQYLIRNPSRAQVQEFTTMKSIDKKNDENKDITPEDKEAMIVIIRKTLCLKPFWCLRLLEEANWDIELVMEHFIEACESKEIPDEAFE